jgi:hypothetical protein
MKCPKCDGNVSSVDNQVIFHCKLCKIIFTGKSSKLINTFEDYQTNIIENSEWFDDNELLICCNPNHKMFMEYGFVNEREVFFVRVLFKGKFIWMLKNNMSKVPKEWI